VFFTFDFVNPAGRFDFRRSLEFAKLFLASKKNFHFFERFVDCIRIHNNSRLFFGPLVVQPFVSEIVLPVTPRGLFDWHV